MTGPKLSREKDVLDLQILDLWDGDRLSAQKIGQRVGMTRNAVLGRIHRLKHEEVPCLCTTPENRDGGMPRGGWK